MFPQTSVQPPLMGDGQWEGAGLPLHGQEVTGGQGRQERGDQALGPGLRPAFRRQQLPRAGDLLVGHMGFRGPGPCSLGAFPVGLPVFPWVMGVKAGLVVARRRTTWLLCGRHAATQRGRLQSLQMCQVWDRLPQSSGLGTAHVGSECRP